MPVIHHGILNEPTQNEIIWRYMSLFKFKDLLTTCQLFLCRLDNFDDPMDGRVPNRNYEPDAQRTVIQMDLIITGLSEKGITIENRSGKKTVPLVQYLGGGSFESNLQKEKARDVLVRKSMFASCWHKNAEENAVFWNYFKSEPTVAIKTTVGSLVKAVSSNSEPLYLCNVQYFDENTAIPSQNGFYQASHKRLQYAWEREVRLLYWCPRTSNGEKNPDDSYKINVNIQTLALEIWLSPNSDERFASIVKEIVAKAGLTSEVKRSNNITT
jgi:hypothetical protein